MAERQLRLTVPVTIASDVIRMERVEADRDGLILHYKLGVVDVNGRFTMRERAAVRVDKSALSTQQNQARRELIRAFDLIVAQAGLGVGAEEDEPDEV